MPKSRPKTTCICKEEGLSLLRLNLPRLTANLEQMSDGIVRHVLSLRSRQIQRPDTIPADLQGPRMMLLSMLGSHNGANRTIDLVCGAKTVWTTLDSLSDVNLCYAGHFQATQAVFRKRKKRDNFKIPVFEPFNTYFFYNGYNGTNITELMHLF